MSFLGKLPGLPPPSTPESFSFYHFHRNPSLTRSHRASCSQALPSLPADSSRHRQHPECSRAAPLQPSGASPQEPLVERVCATRNRVVSSFAHVAKSDHIARRTGGAVRTHPTSRPGVTSLRLGPTRRPEADTSPARPDARRQPPPWTYSMPRARCKARCQDPLDATRRQLEVDVSTPSTLFIQAVKIFRFFYSLHTEMK
jgi:hypothetical protein